MTPSNPLNDWFTLIEINENQRADLVVDICEFIRRGDRSGLKKYIEAPEILELLTSTELDFLQSYYGPAQKRESMN